MIKTTYYQVAVTYDSDHINSDTIAYIVEYAINNAPWPTLEVDGFEILTYSVDELDTFNSDTGEFEDA